MYVLLTVSGRDRVGIVQDVAEALLHIRANIEDSSMTALRGRFTMMLIVHLHDTTSMGELKAVLAELEQRTALRVQSQLLQDDEVASVAAEPDAVVTVSGADQAGIVFAVSCALAQVGVSIVDVSTQARHNDGGDSYMMVLEVCAGEALPKLPALLQPIGKDLAVDIHVHDLEHDIL